MNHITGSTSNKLTKKNDKFNVKLNNLAWIRRERAKEAFFCLRLSGHEVSKGIALDVGCGLGYVTDYFLVKGIQTIGFDIKANVLSKAKIVNPSMYLLLASGVNLPFKDQSFYTVILNDVLEHVSYRDGKFILKQIRNIMKPKGKLYISVANKYQIREPHTLLFFVTWLPRILYDPIIRKMHNMVSIYPYTVNRLSSLCNEIGFINKNYTSIYANKKILNIKHIGDFMTKKIIKLLKDIKISNKFLLYLAEKFSVILFICEK
jgi:SAM-dependent methyltransferase